MGALDSHSNKGCGGLEANAYEHDLFIGVLLSKLERIERRIDDVDRATFGLFLEEA